MPDINLLEFDLNSFGFEEDVTVKLPGWDDFCEAIEEMQCYISPMTYIESSVADYAYMLMQEDVSSHKTKKLDNIRSIAKNTADTTVGLAKSHGDVTDAGGALMKTTWDLCQTGMNLSTRLISFIANNMSKVPKMINTVLTKMIDMPDDIKKKIRGNFNLNIDYNSLSTMHAHVLPLLQRFIATASTVVKGSSWKTLFDGLADPKVMSKAEAKVKSLFDAESKYIRQLEAGAKSLKSFNITPTNIDASNPKNIEAYFGAAKSVNSIDPDNNTPVKVNYYQGLQELSKALSKHQSEINDLYKACNTKFTNTVAREGFAQLSDKQQKRVQNIINCISTALTVVSKLIKAVLEDMNTLFQQYKKIQQRYSGAANSDIESGIQNDKSQVRKDIRDAKKKIKD